MKQRFTLYLVFFMVVVYTPCVAQQAAASSAQTAGIYEVKKKTERVSEIAKKLKIDPILICSLNNITNVDSMLIKGQKILIAPPVENQQQVQTQADTMAKQQAQPDTVVKQPVQAGKEEEIVKLPPPHAQPQVDTELIQNRILLTDATLDLNRTLLQGIQASLDSLNVKDKSVVDEKNISLTIHHMQRQRDKAMLTPVLMHMQDSLKIEIKKEEAEKQELENTLNGIGASSPKPDTMPAPLLVKDTVALKPNIAPPVVEVEIKDTLQNTDTGNKPTPINIDTSAVATSVVQHTEKQAAPEPVHVKPVIEASPSVSTPVMHWETAKAIYYNNEDAEAADQNANDLTTASPALNGGTDTTAYLPSLKGSDTIQALPGSEEARNVRAKYYYTRALKYINQKNYNQVVSYLKKAIDLEPHYYDAWLALGETDAHLGLYTKALNEFKYCQTIDSSSAILFYKMGVVELKLKLKTEAFNNFNRALLINPDYVPAIISRANEYADRNQYRAAIKEYNHVIQIEPSYHSIYKYRAMAEYALKNYSAAIDDFTRFLIFNEADGSAYYHRGMARLEQKQKSDACTDFSVSAKLGYRAASKALSEHCK